MAAAVVAPRVLAETPKPVKKGIGMWFHPDESTKKQPYYGFYTMSVDPATGHVSTFKNGEHINRGTRILIRDRKI